MNFRHVFAGGVHYRVADAAWADPLDASYSARTGARWNAPESFGVLYLSTTLGVARANVRRLFRGQPYGPEDLDPSAAPVLIDVDLQEDDYVDVVTPEGIAAAGLPATYPLAADGGTVPHTTCQPVGQEAYLAGERGMVCISAARGTAGTELAWFALPNRCIPARIRTRGFPDWYWHSPG